jgi:hypothetical protein
MGECANTCANGRMRDWLCDCGNAGVAQSPNHSRIRSLAHLFAHSRNLSLAHCAIYFSIGTPTEFPHSVQEPS